jgi:hypothetical protein
LLQDGPPKNFQDLKACILTSHVPNYIMDIWADCEAVTQCSWLNSSACQPKYRWWVLEKLERDGGQNPIFIIHIKRSSLLKKNWCIPPRYHNLGHSDLLVRLHLHLRRSPMFLCLHHHLNQAQKNY